jgi:acyl-coenzyme A synthetase/AMP-(fatty) acid ligase
MKLVKSIVFQARNREGEPAIAFPGGVATYGALIKSTGAAVDALRTFQLPAGAMVMLDIRNPIHHTAMIFALALLGIPSASVATTFVAEKAGFLPRLFLTDRESIEMPGARTIRVDERWFAADPAARPDYARLLALPGFSSPERVVRYVYSSGTTGFPKCVALTEACLELRMSNAFASAAWWMSGPAALSMLGFSTIAGIMMPLWSHLQGSVLCYAGGQVEALQMLQLFRVNTMLLAVGQLQSFLKILGDNPPPLSLKMLSIGGAKITHELLEETRARLSSYVQFAYGSTEMGAVSSGAATTLDMPEGFSGYLQPWVKVETVDGSDEPLAPGMEGILRVQTPELAFYVDAQGNRLEMMRDGWFYPGDIGQIDARGRLMITGRATEVINRGGVIVAPEAIEEVLRLDPAVKEVAVVGVTNASGIEEIWAAVVSDTLIDPRAIIERVRPRLNEKVPDRVIQVNEIPKAESSKIRRNELRERLIQLAKA